MKGVNLLVILGGVTLSITSLYFCFFIHNSVAVICLSVAFTLGLAIGGRGQLWFSMINRSSHRQASYPLNWQTGSITVIALFLIFTYFYEIDLMALIAPLLTLVYGLAKIRCWLLGCCGWNRTRYPLQLFESAYNIVLSAILLNCLHHSRATTALLLFATFYPFGRLLFQLLRGAKLREAIALNLIIFLLYFSLYLK